MATAWHDFGQRVDLTARIREILLNYPEGTSIFKELIQNADDAGARTISFCLDEQQHGVDRLAYGGLAPLQGPALLVCNDATFTDADFQSISSVGNSVKRAMSGKTGRYGIGFSAVYHLTDVPSFVSGRHLAIFDPHCKYLPNLAADNPGKRIDFVANPLGSDFPDQSAPYCAFGCDMRSHFDGTLFRFPLRSEALAADSRISKQVYTVAKMREQLETLAAEAASLLLFLRNVERCEVLVWSAGADQPQLLHSCTVQGAGPDFRRQRAVFQEAGSSSAILAVHQLTLQTTDHSTQQSVEHTFLVGQSNGGGHGGPLAAFAAKAAQALGAPLVPWGAVAAPLTTPGMGEGRAYCFLPLPVSTGLPAVHINGLFELSSNRRDIWAGSDMRGAGADRSEWNLRLLEEVIAPLYAHVLGEAAGLLGKGAAYSRLWPAHPLQAAWDRLLKGFLASVLDQPVVPSAADSGKAWLTPKEVVFADAMAAREEDLMAALAAIGTPLPALEAPTIDLLLRQLPGAPRLLTPAWLRQHLQAAAANGTNGRVQMMHAAALLGYVVADIVDSDAEMVSELAGLPLLPLASGGLAALQLDAALPDVHDASSGSSGRRVYLAAAEDEVLLAAALHLLLDRAALGPELAARLSSIAALEVLNVRRLTAQELSTLLPVLLPAAWRGAATVQWTPGQHGQPTEAWLEHIWAKLQGTGSLAAFVGWPLLPLRGDRLGLLNPLDSSTAIRPCTKAEWPSALLDAIETLGCRVLASHKALEHPQLSAHVHDGDGAGLLAALQTAIGSSGSAQPIFDRQQITPMQRRALRKLLLQQRWLTAPGGGASSEGMSVVRRRHTLQQLPIFETAASAPAAGASASEPAVDEAASSPHSTLVADGSALPDEPLFVDLLGRRFIAPSSIPPAALPDSFVAVSDEAQPAALALLGVQRPTEAAVYRQHVFPRLASLRPEAREAAMLLATRAILQLSAQDGTITAVMRRLVFVPTATSGLKAPCELHDPRVPELHGLLDSGRAFPLGLWAEESMLAALSMLGLQTALGPAAVLDVARHVEAAAAGDPSAAAARGKALLAYLDVEASRLAVSSAAPGGCPAADVRTGSGASAPNVGGSGVSLKSLVSRVGTMGQALLGAQGSSGGERGTAAAATQVAAAPQNALWGQLRAIHWCPVLTEPPDDLSPWPEGPAAAVAAPAAVRPAGDLPLASATKRILATDCRSPALLEGLQWNEPPDPQTLAAQLRALSLKHSSSGSISADRRQTLAVIVPQLLQALSGASAAELQGIVSLLADAPVIWTGAGFIAIDNVAFRGPLSLDPWLYVVPLELAPFASLLRRLGVAEGFSAAQFVRVLHSMAEQNGSAPLDNKSTDQALSIVQALSSMDVGGQQVYVPDERGCLLLAADMVYNDAPWLDSAGPSKAVPVVHPKISNEVADAVGVASLRRRLLAEGADHFRLEAAEAFGQSEALTTRLKHITDAYADGPGVLLELVQNADDAGATEVAFMLDGRSYPADSVLGPGMAAWQGPALCCYNDAVFSAADLRAISRIGQDSKLDKPEATGRFGLGWNSVYHFTDVPSFCSGDNIVLFDPHAKYLPGISAAQPGLRIGFERANLAARFPDAVAPYCHFSCDVRRRFPGTFFRFPLRTEELAAVSEIKHTAYSPADVMTLFGAFQQQAADALLFVKNVRTLSVMTSDGTADKPRLLFRLRLTAAKGQSHPQRAITQFTRGADREAVLQRLAGTAPQDLPRAVSEVAVSHEDAAGMVGRPQRWLVCAALAGGRPLQMAAQARRDESRGLVPWVGAAAPLPELPASAASSSAHSASVGLAKERRGSSKAMPLADDSIADSKAASGRAFVFLPLPIATGLPLHVNGCFELSSNRRELWLGTDMAGAGARRAAWNQALLQDGVAAAYAQTLLRAAEVLGPTAEYYGLWPVDHLAAPWNLLAEALYQQVATLPVIWCPAAEGNSGRWIAPQQAELPDEACRLDGQLRAALLAAGVPLADPRLPPAVCSMLLAHSPGAEALRPALLRRRLAAPGWRFAGSDAEAQAAAPLLLQQCLEDILDDDATSVAQLASLPLAPLADGRRGTLQLASQAGAAGKLYLASEEDVALLGDAQSHLLLQASGPLQQRLAAIAAGGVLNLAPLSAAVLADVFLPAMLPSDWRGAAEVQWIPGQDGQPTSEALAALWTRIVAFPPADAQRFRTLPLMPVEGGRLAAPAARPVIALGAWAPGVGSALTLLGCRLLDATRLPEVVMQVQQFVHPASGTGLLAATREAAVAAVAGSQSAAGAADEGSRAELHTAADHFAAAGLEAAERNQLREFLLQERWFANGEPLPPAAITTLKQLPIFCCGAPLPQSLAGEPVSADQGSLGLGAAAQAAAGRFTSLASATQALPPAGTPEALLSPDHLVAGSAQEAAILMSHLGVPQLDVFQFAAQHLVPHAAALPAGPRDAAFVALLRSLSDAPAELRQTLPEAAFVSTAAGALLSPKQLFDPRNGELAELLDGAASFPSPVFSSDEQVLSALAQLGMRTAASLAALVDIARQLEAAGTLVAAEPAAAEGAGVVGTLQRRAAALLDHLGRAAQHEGDESHVQLWEAVTRLSWCPVLTQPPVRGLPWPAASQTRAQQRNQDDGSRGRQLQRLPPVAPPRLARPPADLWLVSAGMRVVSAPGDWQPSAALAHRLGWATPPSPNVMAVQLVELGRLHAKVAKIAAAHQLEGVADRLYSALSAAMVQPAAADVIKATLDSSAWVWVGNGFTVAAAAALQGIADLVAPLRTVPADLAQQHSELLLELGVAQKPGISHFAHGLAQLAKSVADARASERQIAGAAALAELLAAQVLQGEPLPDVAIALPDADGIFEPPASLCVNDADWLPSDGVRLVHPAVPLHAAEALGAQSLRFHHQVSTDHTKQLPCPPAQAIAAALDAQQARGMAALCDIAEVAEAAGAEALELWLDCRQHPSQSMLQPGLADFQGLAICIRIPGVRLHDKELSELQLPRQPFRLRDNTCTGGTGLLAAYALTDLPIAMPGDSLCMWDPSGGVLAAGRRPSSAGSGSSGQQPPLPPQGRKFQFVDTPLPERFADQFAPWDFGGADVATGCTGTLLRLALRTPEQAAAGGVSKESWSEDTAAKLLGDFVAAMTPSLLFQRHLRRVRVMCFEANASEPYLLAQVAVSGPGPEQKHVFEEGHRSGIAAIGDRLRAQRPGKTRLHWREVHRQEGDEAVVVERWLVVGCHGAGRSADAAADRRLVASGTVPAAGVAVQLDVSGKLQVHTVSGLSALLPVPKSLAAPPPTAADGGTAETAPKPTTMPLHIAGHFLLSRAGARKLAWQGTTPDDAAARFNLELLACVRAAWGEAFRTLLDAGTANLYALVPPAAALLAARPNSPDTLLAQQVCQDLVSRQVWRLRSGRLAGATDAAFLQEGDGAGMGPAALAWLLARAPMHEAPGHVKADLEASGASGLASLTPASVRSMLKKAVSKRGTGSNVTAQEAAELLHFCFGDIYDPEATAAPGSAQAAGLEGEVAAAVTAVQSRLAGGLAAARGLLQEAQAAAQTGGLPALGTWAAERGSAGINADVSDATSADQQQGLLTGARGAYSLQRVRDCAGLPVPTGSGAIVLLGSRQLFAWPPNMTPTPLDVFPPAARDLTGQFLSSDVVQQLGRHFAAPAVATSLQVRPYTLAAAERHLPAILPPQWAARPPTRTAGRAPLPARVLPWQPNQAPSQQQLQTLWHMLVALQQHYSATAHDAAAWDTLTEWGMLPLAAGGVTRMCHRALVFAPPPPLPPPPVPAALVQEPQSTDSSTSQPDATALDSSPAQDSGAGGASAADMLAHGIAALGLDAPADVATDDSSSLPAGISSTLTTSAPGTGTADSSDAGNPSASDDNGVATSATVEAVEGAETSTAAAQAHQHPEAPLWAWLTPMLLRLGLPVLHPDFGMASQACWPAAASATEPTEDIILHKLRLCSEAGLLQVDAMSADDRGQLLLYFAAHVPGGLQTQDVDLLLWLPIFPGIAHTSQSPMWRPLTGATAWPAGVGGRTGTDAAVCPNEVLSAVCGGWAELPAVLQDRLLQHDAVLTPLYERLSVPSWTAAQLLAQGLLPAWPQLPPQVQQQVLRYVQRQWSALNLVDAVKTALSTTPFVDTGVEGLSARPDELFDPSSRLLRLVFAGQSSFPVGAFASAAWLEILREVGLKHKVEDAETFTACAQRVAANWADAAVSYEPAAAAAAAMKAAELLATHLATKADALFAPHVFHQLGSIAFVPATKAAPGQAGGERVLACFAESAVPSDWALSWAAVPILEDMSVPPTFAWSALRLKSPPVVSTVITHLQAVGADGGEAALAAWPAGRPAPDATFAAVAAYLSNQGLTPTQASQLTMVPMVPVAAGSRLIAPGRLFARLPQNLAPFAYELPADHRRWDRLLRTLGMRDAPSPGDLLQLAADVAAASGGAALNANDRAAALRLLDALCSDADAAQVKATRQAAARDEVPVLTADGRLAPAAACVHIGSAPRSLLRRVDARRLAVAHPKLGPAVATMLDIPALEHVVMEVLDSFGAPGDNQLQSIQDLTLAAARERLKLPPFAAAVCDVLRASADAVPSLQSLPLDEVAERLAVFASSLRFVDRCYTRIVRRADGAEAGDALKVPFFVDLGSKTAVVATPPPGVPAASALAAAISAALGSPVPLPLQSLLAADAAQLPAIAAELAPGGLNDGTGGGLEVDRLVTAGAPGTPLLAADAACAHLRPLRPFCAGELCAYMPGERDSQEQQLLYGRVTADARPPAGQPLHRVPLEVAPGTYAELLSTQVWCFSGSDSASGDMHGNAAVQDTAHPAAPAGWDRSGSAATANAAGVQGSVTTAARSAAASEDGSVSAKEAAAAVTEMLAAAGLPAGAESSQLLAQALELRAEKDELRLKASQLQQDLSKAAEAADAAAAAWQCRICLGATVDAAMQNCGHTLCMLCANSVPGRCAFCRTPGGVLRIYNG